LQDERCNFAASHAGRTIESMFGEMSTGLELAKANCSLSYVEPEPDDHCSETNVER
jgi:hypothetical protein